ncbi:MULTISPECIES: SMC-Scp complex subunit ScpB [Brevibacillus]|jgi:segregation and condensation protein B|uniref:Segregation and condensation protein B n=1 Tax=Brevibacillus borstelensis AK1 TaxID=1300222 RepID=M8E320_9BACL|nr:SMC-Scp complex subunit ScpB [Brevibacillus borstelensis]EMT53656.1 segregation and condensation protein B [Brevibacillus borstelensis AK1]KKX56925.1 segregation protein A [Brevibacillus borstelensis cifa_chp40]MBE5397734.1 SMC-Scp complex subunit ScpB [Brevibacillus borstelensis]MCC0562671.1 SMC-Scp complex subunit ScpB [Brevibacillus borstelensis]MCM3469720.1 SMC-Scp complex subunit ScpB [Brevibacillus borstelensis]
MDYDKLKGVIEGLLFISGDEGIDAKQISEIVEVPEETIVDLIEDMKADFRRAGRGIQIVEVARAYQLTTLPEHVPYFERLATSPSQSTLSQAALETLAIVAYRQPITRSEIEEIRGVKCEKALNTLLSKQLIREAGRAEGVGRPILYATTKEFLEHFGLRELSDLPEPPVSLNIEEARMEAAALFGSPEEPVND